MARRYLHLQIAAVAILAGQGIASQVLHRDPILPSPPPLTGLPLRLGEWLQVTDEVVPPDVLEMLGPDDILSRRYQVPGEPGRTDLFAAYYKSQLRGKNAHDPKVCLPGAGWNPLESRVVPVQLTGTANAVPVNYYLIAKDDNQEVVLYWFQTPRGTYYSEQQLSLHRLVDAIRDNRTDMVLVRIIVPVGKDGAAAATAEALKFAQLIYPAMALQVPGKLGGPNV